MRKLIATLCLTLTVLLVSAAMSASEVIIEDNAIASFRRGLTAYNEGDYATALREWRPLAQQGDADAQNNLGVLFLKGQGVPKHYEKAVVLFRLSAKQGNSTAQSYLGGMYGLGQGVKKNLVTAYIWASLGAYNGNEKGAKLRDIFAKRMTPKDISTAQELARECFWKNYRGCRFEQSLNALDTIRKITIY